MSDISGSPSDVLDLTTAGVRAVRVPGAEEPVPVDQLIPKSVFTQKTQELAQMRQQLEAQNAPAAELFQALQEDPVGFYQELGARLGMLQGDGGDSGTQDPTAGLDLNDPRVLAAIQKATAPLLGEIDGLKKFVFNKSARDSIDAEINRIKGSDPNLTQTEIGEVLQIATALKLPTLDTAYRVWKHDKLQDKTQKLTEELEVTKRKAAFPQLGGASERNVAQQGPRKTLEEIFEAKKRELGLG